MLTFAERINDYFRPSNILHLIAFEKIDFFAYSLLKKSSTNDLRLW
jgi:hypothetical protein